MKRIMLLVLLACCLLLTGCYTGVLCTDIARYEEDCARIENAAALMPRLAELGDYQELRYARKQTIDMIFCSEGLGLYAWYDEAEYAAQKERLLSTLPFIDEPVTEQRGTDVLLASDFMYRDYLMKAVPDEAYVNYGECKSFMLVGFNDQSCSIAYLYFYNMDLDYIALADEDPAEEMRGHIDDYFLWLGK